MTLAAETHRHQAAPGSPRAAWVVGVACWLLGLSSLVLFFSSTGGGRLADDWLFVLTDAGMAAVYGTVASLLLARRRHVVIIFLLVAAVGGGIAAFGGAWRHAVLIGRLPPAPVIESMFSTAWVPGTLSLFLVVPWLVRRVVDRRARLQALPGLLITIAFLVVGRLIPEEAFAVVVALLLLVVAWGLVSAAAVELRRRTAGVGESEGLSWLALGTAVLALSFVPLTLPYGLVPFWIVPALHLACQSVFPVAILTVVARQRLWGLELSVSRAAVAGALTAVLVAVYLVVSVVISQGHRQPDRGLGRGRRRRGRRPAAVPALAAASGPTDGLRGGRRSDHGGRPDGLDAGPGGVGGRAAGLGHRDPRTHAAAGVGDPGRRGRAGARPLGDAVVGARRARADPPRSPDRPPGDHRPARGGAGRTGPIRSGAAPRGGQPPRSRSPTARPTCRRPGTG